MKNLLIALLIGAAVWHFYLKPEAGQRSSSTVYPASTAPSSAATSFTKPAPRAYSCDGRTHCSQMRSCEEATYFLRNCPGTTMDGDMDGVPCEQQHCR
ncbi:excalibur calcium-binding domain-containing protein [Stutzerimonas stutzeri]|uniref:excalibur calcium-binding domain-containing protein n=1 Tax=Stutzerimonas stutzeri TaxID=316 RepID=UPI0009E74865|nr:excalibur calcium-binding domain-containing protein [Stutzerimonas stutzeri]MDH2248421.1 excalibur calcium-binding domain-containing protein [Pseudomonas sp. GD03856]MDH2267208.1 excalibur calcium-binding domain-containing protein [Pseudomonas sp. GD03855]MDH0214402.1 excalibur calcium-binding domain-containing protein [Stutzerimonas stutzeri]MDH0258765.1 excalibur calcium-binding domain-containing protein [Stutzerimonas stutzeri]MDH0504694.1 excalibur calcium-binding domain-containing prot